VSFRHLCRQRNSASASVVSTLKSVCLRVKTTLHLFSISSSPRGQNRSYYCFWKKVFSWTSAKKLLDGSLCEGRAVAGVVSDTLDIRESYAHGSLATVSQTEVYAILACSDYCRSANIHNMTICICSDSKAALLALSSYTISS
jgi:hypothetical protein